MAKGEGLGVVYRLGAVVSHDLAQLEGSGTIEVTNLTENSINEIYLRTLPDYYGMPDKKMSWSEIDLRYVRGVEPGWMDLSLRGGAGQVTPVSGEILRMGLSQPLEPGKSLTIQVSFRTRFPKKRGPFGRLDRVLTVQGGWYPLVLSGRHGPASPAEYQVNIRYPKGTFWIDSAGSRVRREKEGREEKARSAPPSGSREHDPRWVQVEAPPGDRGENPRTTAEQREAPESLELSRLTPIPDSADKTRSSAPVAGFSFSVSRRFQELEVGELHHRVLVYRKRKKQLSKLGQILDQASRFYERFTGRHKMPMLEIAFAPLDQRLAVPAVGFLLVSDQLFRILPMLDVFHERSLLDGYYEALLMRDYPSLRARPWEFQFLARSIRQGYFQEKYGLGKSLKDVIRGPLRLLPAFDELINGADFPGRQFYLQRIEVEGEVPEDIFSHGMAWMTGALVAERLGRFVGEAQLIEDAREFLTRSPAPESLRSYLEERRKKPLDWFFQQWLGPPRPLSFKIASVETEKLRDPSGPRYRTTVEVARTGSRIDLLEVELKTRGKESLRKSILLEGDTGKITFESHGKPKRVSLDPRSDLDDPWRADNLKPPRLKFLLYNSRVNLESKSGELNALLRFGFLRQHDYRRLLFIEATQNPIRTGVTADLTWHYGEAIDPLRFPLAFRAGAGFERISGDSDSGDPAQSLLTFRFGIQYDTTNYLSEVDQKNDTFIDLLIEGSSKQVLGDSSFLIGRLELARHQRLDSRVTASGRLFVGMAAGEFPSNKRFILGSANALRGFVADEVLAENVGLVSMELRTDLLRNFDFSFFRLAFLNRLQVVTFGDAALSSASRNLFDGKGYADVGFGLRLHGRWFGIMPSMGKIDVGFPILGSEGGGYKVFLGLTQAF